MTLIRQYVKNITFATSGTEFFQSFSDGGFSGFVSTGSKILKTFCIILVSSDIIIIIIIRKKERKE